MDIKNIKEPQSIGDKKKLAKQLRKELSRIMDKKKEINWEEGKILYYFDQYKLYSYLGKGHISKINCWKEIGIPPATAQFKIKLYSFYVIQHQFSLGELRGASEKKLHRVAPLLEGYPRENIKEVIIEAKKSEEGLEKFLAKYKKPIIIFPKKQLF